jgi:putative endonuclease
MTDDRRRREGWGRKAESLAAFALRLKGYRVLAHRRRTPAGEIDLIVRRGAAASSVSTAQRRRIVRAATHYIAANPGFGALTQRFDAVLIVPRRWPIHIINAWSESDD